MKPHLLFKHRRAAFILFAALLAGCQPKPERVNFIRFEQLLFDTPSDRLEEVMKSHREEYNTELILFFPDEPEFMQMTIEFVSDPVMRDIYHITDSLYHDLSDVESQLGRALSRAYKLCPKMQHIDRFYTMVTGDFNYNFRVFGNGTDLCVALDQYALGSMERYGYFGMPNYLVHQFRRDQIVPDCMHLLGGLYSEKPEGDLTLLDYAINEGKILYFIEQTLPGIADTTLLHYTGEQLDWMKRNTANVWSWLLQNKLLYSTDVSLFRNIIDDAPKTNAFGEGSAPRTTSYIGWQIVRAYAKKTGCPLEQLFQKTSSQEILTTSAWRP